MEGVSVHGGESLSIEGVSVHGRDLRPWKRVPGVSVRGVSVQGVSVRETLIPPERDPPTVMSGRYVSEWNALLFKKLCTEAY